MIIDIKLLVGLRRFIEEHCVVRLYLVERGGASNHKHFQMAMKGNFRILHVLNEKIKVARIGSISFDGTCPYPSHLMR